MAHLERLYRCPCGALHDTFEMAMNCARRQIREEKWAIGESGKGVRIFDNYPAESKHGIIGALREADLSDLLELRERQLEEMKKGGDAWKYLKPKSSIREV